ncbi:hypothetical protein CO674_05410 [Rhizobium hidalgonense]|uniref:Uncharacterized protein n=1 Tax=Rhizobium hidalgonense TaxID=1538159 RepID=A0ABX4JXL8_9HYPH|nr:hypothetical protein CO674_05410 [Rhizobium hidalgonense]
MLKPGQSNSLPLIPVLGFSPRDVTGIQRAQVIGRRRVIHGADAPWLDSFDQHRNEGVGGSGRRQ